MKIRKDDNVIVISGKDKGKKGKVLEAFPSLNKVVVDGVNMAKKHIKPRQNGKAGEIVERPMPVDVSNVAIVDSKTGKASRVGYKIEGDKKVRISKASGQTI